MLDPIVLQLDNLAQHLDPRITGADWIDTLTRWLGMTVDLDMPLDVRRRRVVEAMALNRGRGTLEGLRHEIAITLPGAGIEVSDNARVTTGEDPFERPPAPLPELVVTLPPGLGELARGVLERLVEDELPAHVAWRCEEAGAPRDAAPVAGASA